MKKKVGIVKRLFSLLLIFLISINSFAAIVSDNDGSAFITKAEFDALKNNFQSQIDTYNSSIDSKIDGAIASYLSGIQLSTSEDVHFLVSDSETVKFFDNFRFHKWGGNRPGNATAQKEEGWQWTWGANGTDVVDYYGTESNYPWGQAMYWDWTNKKDIKEIVGGKSDFWSNANIRDTYTNHVLYAAECWNSGTSIEPTFRGYLLTFDLTTTEYWDYQNNKIYKNLVALGKKDGNLFYPGKVYPGVACTMKTGGFLLDVSPVFHYSGNNSSYWRGDQGKTITFSPDTDDTTSAIAIKGYMPVSSLGGPHTWKYRWSSGDYRLFQTVTNITNHYDKSLNSSWEQGRNSLDLSNVMCIANKTLYISCVGGSQAPIYRKFADSIYGAAVEIVDPWWQHTMGAVQSNDYTFGSGVADKQKYKIVNVKIGGPIRTDWTTTWQSAISWDGTTELSVGCPKPLMNCKIKDLGSTVLRDNDGLTVKIGDGLPVCSIDKEGILKLVFKVTSSDNQNVKLSFKFKGFQETGDYLKDDTGALWNNKTVTSGTTYTVNFPIETINETIYCGILNGDNTGVRNSKISLISGIVTYDK